MQPGLELVVYHAGCRVTNITDIGTDRVANYAPCPSLDLHLHVYNNPLPSETTLQRVLPADMNA
jgi:hypothetical protein